ncbi:hypothetical protein B0A52_01203 [Exophiala mesophila]|uniref:Aldehyde dehydrogenase domain-containing protein n=1 Tax=Exophiala mesophila TaxID=212818 RepID=A0A438NGU2_EXOME|nr:hypothetical protein B0A52_01203 [Exophiala mesophila]
MTSSEIKLLLSSAVDGRTRDLRYRQNQLLSLHQWIANHRIALEHAIERDEHVEEHEAQFVVSMTLREVQAHYDELDLTKALEEEYRVKNGRNNAGARSPEALIYVIPEKFTLFYSALSTLSACIAAGSCCIIELPSDLTHSVSVARQCLSQCLDRTAFTFTTTRPPVEDLARCLVVDQTGIQGALTGKRVLRSQPQSWAVALVDRTANLELAAKEILLSRRFFSGRGPYAPTCILVNEFVEQPFLHLLKKEISRSDGNDVDAVPNVAIAAPRKLPKNAGEVLLSQDRLIDTEAFKLVMINDRSKLCVHSPKSTKTLCLLPISSHDDGIDTLNNHTDDSLLALYVFASPPVAKYLTQFVRSTVSFVNHIPANLLVGPAAPVGYSVSPVGRYRCEMMENPSPKFVSRVSGEVDLREVAQKGSEIGKLLHQQSLRPLKPTGQPREGDSNFFQQGMLVGLIFLVLPVVTGSLIGTSYLTMKLYRRWR